MSGQLIVIVAASGTGKSTLLGKLRREFPQFKESVSCTTRPMRSGEREGVDYFFLSPEVFAQKLERREFLEWAEVHGHHYATMRTTVAQGLDRGEVILFDLDVQGCDAIRGAFAQAKIIFIEPPSLVELERRLVGRGTESPAVVRMRLQNAQSELARKNDFDYLICNDQFDATYRQLKQIVEQIVEGS